jgi:hypothetical protein
VEEEREKEGCHDGAEAADERGSAVPALPIRPEPGDSREQGEHTEAPRPRLDPGEETRREEAEPGREIGSVNGSGRGRVGGARVGG